jgi:hypothetical protein
LNLLDRFWKKSSNTKVHKNPSSEENLQIQMFMKILPVRKNLQIQKFMKILPVRKNPQIQKFMKILPVR